MKKQLVLALFLLHATLLAAEGRSPTAKAPAAAGIFPLQEGFVDAGGVLIYYKSVGKGPPLSTVEYTDRLSAIRVPTLITAGDHDECDPSLSRVMHEKVGGSKLVVFPQSGQMTFVDQPRSVRPHHRGVPGRQPLTLSGTPIAPNPKVWPVSAPRARGRVPPRGDTPRGNLRREAAGGHSGGAFPRRLSGSSAA